MGIRSPSVIRSDEKNFERLGSQKKCVSPSEDGDRMTRSEDDIRPETESSPDEEEIEIEEESSTQDETSPDGESSSEDTAPESGPVFWKELYGFVVVTLFGVALGLFVLPPKAKRYWSLLEHEAELSSRNAELRQKARKLELATYAFQTDAIYREAVLRLRLGRKRNTEEYLSNVTGPPGDAEVTESEEASELPPRDGESGEEWSAASP